MVTVVVIPGDHVKEAAAPEHARIRTGARRT
jgi:hypothetical protein